MSDSNFREFVEDCYGPGDAAKIRSIGCCSFESTQAMGKAEVESLLTAAGMDSCVIDDFLGSAWRRPETSIAEGWVAIDEDDLTTYPPEFPPRVWLFSPKEEQTLCLGYYESGWGFLSCEDDDMLIPGVTHWMLIPMPVPPTQ